MVALFKNAKPDELFTEVGVYSKVGKSMDGCYKHIMHIQGAKVGTLQFHLSFGASAFVVLPTCGADRVI